jgi:hypothetical protein
VKQPGYEADHSPPSIADVKNVWNYTYTPPICLHGMVLNLAMDSFMTWYLVKHRDNFTLTLPSQSPNLSMNMISFNLLPILFTILMSDANVPIIFHTFKF